MGLLSNMIETQKQWKQQGKKVIEGPLVYVCEYTF